MDLSTSAQPQSVTRDLRPLAWVLVEAKKTFNAAIKEIKLLLQDSSIQLDENLAALHAPQLCLAGQQIHQVVGAFEMVDVGAPLQLLRGVELALQNFVQQPKLCTQEACNQIERAGFALVQYLEEVLADRPVSSVSLFTQYRDVQRLAGVDRVHPADLWNVKWRSIEPQITVQAIARAYDNAARAQFDQYILKFVKGSDAQAAQELSLLCLGLAQEQSVRQARIFWHIAAACFEALARGLIQVDVYVKRTVLRVLSQYAQLAAGQQDVAAGLVQELLFFCSQAMPLQMRETSVLCAVRSAYGLDSCQAVDYEFVQFGQVDPVLLDQARKRVFSVRETWSALAGGDIEKFKYIANQLSLVVDSLTKLYPESQALVHELSQVIEMSVKTNQAPSVELAMEVASALLYLEAVFEDFDCNDAQLPARMARLAERLQAVSSGGRQQALEPWMQELYRRMSDKRNTGTVVDQLHIGLSEIEQSLDSYFRDPKDASTLHDVPAQLTRMRGVMSVMGLDQACEALTHMRNSVEQVVDLAADGSQTQVVQAFEQLGNNLSSISFLIDMLDFQPVLAKKLFVFNRASGEFGSVIGQPEVVHSGQVLDCELGPDDFELQEIWPSGAAPSSAQGPFFDLPSSDVPQEDDLRQIFLMEAREVLTQASDALAVLATDAADIDQLLVLRRAFHTLKGSSRMVLLDEFGAAAWAVEQLLNSWLSDQRPANEELRTLLGQATQGLSCWANDIAAGRAGQWKALVFAQSADAMREQGQYKPLVFSSMQAALLSPLDLDPTVPVRGIDLSSLAAFTCAEVSPEQASKSDVNLGVKLFAEEFDQRVWAQATAGLAVAQAPAAAVVAEVAPEVPPAVGTGAVNIKSASYTVHIPTPLAALPVVLSSPAAAVSMSAQSQSVDVQKAQASEAESLQSVHAADNEEEVKVIGSLRIGIPLYNMYLNEADEWSRNLVTEVAEWALQRNVPVQASTVGLAHSLAGTSATVGFSALAEMARLLEVALQQSRAYTAQDLTEHVKLFVDASEDIRRLLHQFAAGFLKQPRPDILQALRSLDFSHLNVRIATDFPTSLATFGAHPEEEIDVVDAIDPDLFATFADEGAELMAQLGRALRQWIVEPAQKQARVDILRVLHTLKGSARLAGAMRLGEMVHRVESDIEQLGVHTPISTQFDALQAGVDAMQSNFDELRQVQSSTDGPASQMLAGINLDLAQAGAPPSGHAWALASRPALESQQLMSGSIRVRAPLLDRMVNQTGEIMVTRSRLEAQLTDAHTLLRDLGSSLERLRVQLREVELETDTQMQSQLVQAKQTKPDFDPLEFDQFTRVQELTRMMAESVDDVATVQRTLQRTLENSQADLGAQANQARQLQHDLLRTRMLEFETIAERLYRVVRQASKETGKQVRLDINGGSIELDRGVLERMMPAFEHLLRNCVVHGIEPTHIRVESGKPATGLITINLHQEGNDVSVEFGDDGAGLNLAAIRDKAVALNVLPADKKLQDAEAVNLIFTPGLTTVSHVTELAGRGIGMDVVRYEVSALGGRIETRTQAGKGTNFRLVLPLTTAVTQVLMLRAGNLSVGVPANVVEVVRRASMAELDHAYNTGVFEVAGQTMPFFWAGALLQASSRSTQVQGKNIPVVVFRSANQEVALHVDEVLGNQEVLVRNLGPQLSRLPGLAGMSVLASGAVVLIYNPVALAAVYGEQARAWSNDAAQPHILESVSFNPITIEQPLVPQAPLVLVVDDSITVRRVMQRLLLREGYRVALANDGMQALEQLQNECPAMVLSDIEMPRMDGFDLLRKIRSDQRWDQLPVVLVTSRMAQKHRDLAKELGANHYLGKPYAEEELLGLVRHYCSVAMAA